jgi:hypothetical protein
VIDDPAQARRGLVDDWVPEWEATFGELSEVPMPALYLSLSRFAHIMHVSG